MQDSSQSVPLTRAHRITRSSSQPVWRVQLLPGGLAAPAATAAPAAVCLSHILELDALFVAMASGELLLLHTATRELEEVGAIAGGVAAAEWSPDGEVLAVAGGGGKLLLLSKVGARPGCAGPVV